LEIFIATSCGLGAGSGESATKMTKQSKVKVTGNNTHTMPFLGLKENFPFYESRYQERRLKVREVCPFKRLREVKFLGKSQ